MYLYVTSMQNGKDAAYEAILRAHAVLTGSEVKIDRLSSGKPVVLFDGKRKGFVSVSHTDSVLAIAFSESETGIDLERKDRKVSARVSAGIADWTAKEAYGKYLGCGINREVLAKKIPDGLVDTYAIGEYVLSVASRDKNLDIINLTSNSSFDIISKETQRVYGG